VQPAPRSASWPPMKASGAAAQAAALIASLLSRSW